MQRFSDIPAKPTIGNRVRAADAERSEREWRVLDCGGKRSATPLSSRPDAANLPKRHRRFDLPAPSVTSPPP